MTMDKGYQLYTDSLVQDCGISIEYLSSNLFLTYLMIISYICQANLWVMDMPPGGHW